MAKKSTKAYEDYGDQGVINYDGFETIESGEEFPVGQHNQMLMPVELRPYVYGTHPILVVLEKVVDISLAIRNHDFFIPRKELTLRAQHHDLKLLIPIGQCHGVDL